MLIVRPGPARARARLAQVPLLLMLHALIFIESRWEITRERRDNVMGQTPAGIRGFCVPTKTKGFTAKKMEGKLSLRASVTSELYFDNVKLPKDAKFWKKTFQTKKIQNFIIGLCCK